MRLTRSAIPPLAFGLFALAAATAMGEVGTGFVRFDVPKELVLHGLVLALALVAIVRRDVGFDRVDRGAGLFLLALVPGALFVTAPSLALRQGALTVSLVALFIHARRDPELAAKMALSVAVVLALSGLAEATGLVSLSAEGFAPGGLTGQRNHLAHAVALGLALAFGRATPRTREYAFVFGASVVLAAALVVTRSRAGWVAAGAAFVVALVTAPRRAVASLLGAMGGVALGVATPLAIHWWDPHPYRETAARLFEYRSGSGAVRIDEARATLRMFRDHFVFGVGPGQWASECPAYAPPRLSALAASTGELPRLAHADGLARLAEGGLLGVAGAFAWAQRSVASLRARGALGQAAPFVVAFIAIELLDAGISIPATGLVAALGAASSFPRDGAAEHAPAPRWPHGAVIAVALAGIAVLLRVRAADRAMVGETDGRALVAACEADPTAAGHCVEAARHALGANDAAAAQRAVDALARAYPAHPVLPSLRQELAGRTPTGHRDGGAVAL
jgi:O-antigen ligase